MRLLDEDQEHPTPRRKSTVWVVLGLALLVGGGYWFLSRPEAPPPEAAKPQPEKEAPKSTETKPPPPRKATPSTGSLSVTANVEGATIYLDGKAVGEVPYRVDGVEPGAYEIRVAQEGYETFDKMIAVSRGREAKVNARLVLEPARLRVESDVPGATVFLDRKYIGTTPVSIADVGPGDHALTVSADGYDIHSETVEMSSGSRDLYVRFKEVRLQETAKVVHKHSFGSCEGTLSATPDGLTYQTTNKKDGFSVPFSSLEKFEVDFIDKNLQIKVRGGRKYNFTEKSGDADVLFVFHKNVEAATKRLADE